MCAHGCTAGCHHPSSTPLASLGVPHPRQMATRCVPMGAHGRRMRAHGHICWDKRHVCRRHNQHHGRPWAHVLGWVGSKSENVEKALVFKCFFLFFQEVIINKKPFLPSMAHNLSPVGHPLRKICRLCWCCKQLTRRRPARLSVRFIVC